MDEGTPYRPNFVPRAGTKQGRRVLNPYFRKALSSGPSSDGGLDRIHSVARDQGFSYHDARSPLDVFEGLREVVDADRAMTITITGSADDLTVHIGRRSPGGCAARAGRTARLPSSRLGPGESRQCCWHASPRWDGRYIGTLRR